MLKSYGGYTWSGEEPIGAEKERKRLPSLALIGAVGMGAAYAAVQPLTSGYRPIDYFAGAARTAGNLFPFQLGNTFRIPEILSPWLSNKYRETTNVSWTKDVLESQSSYDWLKYATGLSSEELRVRGITKGMIGNEVDLASHIIWTPTIGSKGRLEAKLPNNVTHLLSNDISLIAGNEELINPLSSKRGLNKFTTGVFAAADMYNIPGFNEKEVFSSSTISSSYLPIPSMHGKVENLADLSRRSVWLRGIPAFEMGRFNVLMENVVEQFGGETGKKIFHDVLKVGPGIKPGPAGQMFARYGMLAAGAGALIIGNQQLDWVRRQSDVGHLASSALVAGGSGYLASRLGATSKTAFMASVAVFFGQMALPEFDQGLMQGLGTIGVNADILRANPLNPVNYYRRTLEGFAPGISDWKTGALIAVGGMLAAGIKLPGMSERLNVKFARFTNDTSLGEIGFQNKSVRDLFYERIGNDLRVAPEDTTGMLQRMNLLKNYHSLNSGDPLSQNRSINKLWNESEKQFTDLKKNNSLNNRLFSKLETIANTHSSNDLYDRFMKEGKGFATYAYESFLGADLSHNKEIQDRIFDLGFGKFGPTNRFGRIASIGLALFGIHSLVTGGLLGSMESSSDLKKIYSGEKFVEIKESRWWEGGGTPFEGGDTSYYRPHAYALMMNRVREKGIWGVDEDKISPITKFFKKNFTYDLEKQTYWDRPYPVTNSGFSDVPIIGGILGASIGQIIKPSRIMHGEEWIREGQEGPEYANIFKGDFVEPAYSLGARGSGAPVSPNNLSVLYSNFAHQFQELEGITGWAKSVFSNIVFGSEHWASAQARLATSGEMTSWSNAFWEGAYGGAGFTNEFLRRIFPRQQMDIKKYNPLMNSMPSWLPDKFHYGDPYKSVEWGEARLPGAGFGALHPELRDVDPEAYPALYRYQILADVAPLTPEFFQLQQQVYTQRSQNKFTEREIAWIDHIDSNRSKVVNKLNYKDIPDGAIALPGSGLTRAAWSGSRELMRDVVAPLEYLVPMGFRPVQKLTGGERNAIERYEYERLYGTPLAFWDEPIRDWLRPSFYSALNLLGYEGKPLWRQEADAVNQYFDQLEFIKYMSLADQATQAGNGRVAAQMRWLASQTKQGVNPQGAPLSIYWSLPTEERSYFNSFAQAQSENERNRILEMIPGDQVHLYKALWARQDAGDPTLYETDTNIDQKYMDAQRASTNIYPMPGPDWIGWHQDVDMSDIQVRYVDKIGADLHDYGMWESGLRKSEGQSFLDGAETQFVNQNLRFSNIRSEIYNMLGSSQVPPHMSYNVLPGTRPQAQITYNDNRDSSIFSAVQRYINGF